MVEIRDGVIGAGWNELQGSMWPPPVVAGAVSGEDGLQVPFTEDQDAVGELGSDDQNESFGEQFARGQRGG
jgi:hypothetical protein